MEEVSMDEIPMRNSGVKSGSFHPGSGVKGGVGHDLEDEHEQEIYVLVFRKTYLKKKLLEEFEVGSNNKSFSNYFILRLKEIEIKFPTKWQFCSMYNVFDTMGYLNSWFELQNKPTSQNDRSSKEADYQRKRII